MRFNVSAGLVALLFALQGCNAGSAGSGSENSGVPAGDQPPAEQQKPADEQKDPTLADQYIDEVSAGMVKSGAKQEDVDALSAAVRADAKGGAASLNLQNAADFNDPKTVFDRIPASMVKHAHELKLEALIEKVVAESAKFIGDKVSSNDKQGLFMACAKSLFTEAGDQSADVAIFVMKGLKDVVPASALAGSASEVLSSVLGALKETQKDFDFATFKFGDAASAIGDADASAQVFGDSLKIMKDFVPADKLDAATTKLNTDAIKFIGALPKDQVADKMATFNAAVVVNVDADKAGALVAAIQAEIAAVDPSLYEAFNEKVTAAYEKAKVPQSTVTSVNGSANEQLTCPPKTIKTAEGCAASPSTSPDTATEVIKYWVSDETKDPNVHGEFTEDQIKGMGVTADQLNEFKAATMTCENSAKETLMIYWVGNAKTVGRDCMPTGSEPPNPK